MITQQDQETFEKHFHLYEMLIKHSFIRNYTKETYSELIHLYTKYVSEKNNFSHWCSSCRTELVNHLYQWYINNKIPNNSPITPQEIIEEETIEQQIQSYKKKRKK